MAMDLLAALVSTTALLAGAGAMSVPVLIHLLARRRFRRIRWAAMEFLIEAERENRRRIRAEELILLALRCMAVFLVGLLLARWFVQPRDLAAVLGDSGRTERIVLLDDSFSMGLRTPQGTVFDAARAATLRVAQWARQESPQDVLTVLLASQPDRPIVQAIGVREPGAEDLRSQLERLRPSERGPCVRDGLTAVRKLLDTREPSARAAVYVISDFQAIDWVHADAAGITGSPLAALTGWSDGRRTLRVVFLDVGIEAAANLCVSSLMPEQPQAVAGVPARFLANVTNYGRTEARVESLRIFMGEASQPPVPVPPIGPGQTVTVPVELSFPSPGAVSLAVELPDDALPTDNRRYAAVDVQRAIRVLAVEGGGESATSDGVSLLATALRPEGPVFSGNEVDRIEENALEDADLSRYHAVVLANVSRVTEAGAARLERFARAGGGVIVFLGDQVDADLYNRLLYRSGDGLLPARLGEIVDAAPGSSGYRLIEPDLTHPWLRNFAGADVPFFDGILAWRFLSCSPAATSAPATQATTRPAARILLSYDDPDRTPAMIERPCGEGHVALFTSSADKSWTNLPDWFTYVALLQDVIHCIARPADPTGGGGVTVGTPIRIPLEPGRFEPQAAVRSPAFPEEAEHTIEVRPDGPGGTPQLVWMDVTRAGVYQFRLRETGGQPVTRFTAVNPDPREGNLTRCDEPALRSAATELPFTYVAGSGAILDDSSDARRELWPAVWIALVAVLLLESSLAWWWGRIR